MATPNEAQPQVETKRREVRPEQERPTPEQHDGHERSFRSLARELIEEVSALTSAEVALARTEIQQKVTQAERGIAAMAAGGAVLAAGLLALVASAILALALVLPAWLSALLIGGGVALVGVILLAGGKSRVSTERLKPDRTTDSLREDRKFVRRQRHQATEAWR